MRVLTSEELDFVTGGNFDVDGGNSTWLDGCQTNPFTGSCFEEPAFNMSGLDDFWGGVGHWLSSVGEAIKGLFGMNDNEKELAMACIKAGGTWVDNNGAAKGSISLNPITETVTVTAEGSAGSNGCYQK